MGRYVVSGSISLENPRLDALVENCFDSVMITEAGSRNLIVYVNKAFTDLTGYSSEEDPTQQRANSRASVRDNIQPATSTISSCSNS